jgi:hypothetical protein
MLIIVTLISFYASQAQLSVRVRMAQIQQLSPAQLDFENFESTVLLFTIDITYPGTHLVKLVNNQIEAVLRNGATVKMLEGNGFNTDPFNVTDRRSINNFKLGKSGEIKIQDFNITNEAREKIIKPALATGKFPAGIYRFIINAVDADSQNAVPIETEVNLQLESPSQIELRSPREGEITNEFPIFEWTYDGQEVELTINEKLPDMSREEAIGRFPFVFKDKQTGINSFQYPPVGVRHLQKGKTYVWRVVGKIKAAGGDQNIESPLGLFKVEDDINIIKRSELLDRLERTLGSKWQKVFDKIKEKELNPTEAFYLNNKQLSNAELEDILNFLEQNSSSVEKVTLD